MIRLSCGGMWTQLVQLHPLRGRDVLGVPEHALGRKETRWDVDRKLASTVQKQHLRPIIVVSMQEGACRREGKICIFLKMTCIPGDMKKNCWGCRRLVVIVFCDKIRRN